MTLARAIGIVAILAAAGCGDNNGNEGGGADLSGSVGADMSGTAGGGMVMGHARILHGPSTVMTARPPSRRRTATPQAADGRWALSPDQAKVTVVSLSFQGDQPGVVQSVNLSNCVVTYVRDQPSLSQLLDCPFQIPAGTYVSMGIGVSTTFQVLVDDASNGLFTDPNASTKLSTTAPAGGAQFVSLTVAGPGGSGTVLSSPTYFTHPVVVSATGSVGGDDGGTTPGVTVDVVADLVHTLFANVSGGVATFDTNLPLPAVQLAASLEGAGHVAFYTDSGSAGNAMLGGPTSDDTNSVRLFYNGAGLASYEFHPTNGPSQAWAANPANSPVSGTFRAGGYLGIDASGTLCWAIPSDDTWQQYSGLCAMKVVSTIGQTTTLNCQTTTNVPPPTSGDTYASGCPTLSSPTATTLTLVAQ